MVPIRLVLAAALFVALSCVGASAQTQCNGQFAPGDVCANPTGSQKGGTVTPLSPVLDQAFGSTQNQVIFRGSLGWMAGPVPAGSFAIVASSTTTSGFAANDIIASNGSVLIDTAISYLQVGLKNANNIWSGVNNFTGTFEFNGNTMTFPPAVANLGYQSGAWTVGNCLQAGSTMGAIAQASTPCGSGGGGSSIIAGSTPTSGFTSGDIIGSASNLTVDTGLAYANVDTLSGVQTLSGAKTFSGGATFSATVAASFSSGNLYIAGLIGTPTNPGANGEGQEYLSSASGLVIQGQGSTSDFTILGRSGSAACYIVANTTELECFNTFLVAINSNTTAQDAQFRNSNGGSSAASQVAIGNDTSATEATVTVNSSTNTSGNGANSATVNGQGGIFLAGAGTTGFSVNPSGGSKVFGALAAPNIATGTPVSGVCEDSGGNVIKVSASNCFGGFVGADEPNARVSLVSNDPTPTADVSAANTIYYPCYNGNVVAIPNGTQLVNYQIPSCQISALLNSSIHLLGGTTINGYILGDTMTVNSVGANVLAPGQIITGSSTPSGVMIVNQIAGTTGGAGTYNITNGKSQFTASMSGTSVTMTAYVYGDGTHYMPVTGHVLSGTGVTGTPKITSYGSVAGTFSINTSESVGSETITGTLTVGSSGSPVSLTSTGQNAYNIYAFINSGSPTLCVSANAWYAGSKSGNVYSYSFNGSTVEQIHNTLGLLTNVTAFSSNCYNGATAYSISQDNATFVGSVMTTANGQTSVVLHPAQTTSGEPAIIGLANAYRRELTSATSQDSISTPFDSFSIGNPIPYNFNNPSTNYGQNYQIRFVDPLGLGNWTGTGDTGAVEGAPPSAQFAETTELSLDFIPFGNLASTPLVIGQIACAAPGGSSAGCGGFSHALFTPYPTIGTHFIQLEEGSINVNFNSTNFATLLLQGWF